MVSFERAAESFRLNADRADAFARERPALVIGGAVATASAVYLLSKYLWLNTTSDGRKGSLGLALGHLNDAESKQRWAKYENAWDKGAEQSKGATGAGELTDLDQTTSVVNDFYSFVTDIYEWGCAPPWAPAA